jgi:hypothetical protein
MDGKGSYLDPLAKTYESFAVTQGTNEKIFVLSNHVLQWRHFNEPLILRLFRRQLFKLSEYSCERLFGYLDCLNISPSLWSSGGGVYILSYKLPIIVQ